MISQFASMSFGFLGLAWALHSLFSILKKFKIEDTKRGELTNEIALEVIKATTR